MHTLEESNAHSTGSSSSITGTTRLCTMESSVFVLAISAAPWLLSTNLSMGNRKGARKISADAYHKSRVKMKRDVHRKSWKCTERADKYIERADKYTKRTDKYTKRTDKYTERTGKYRKSGKYTERAGSTQEEGASTQKEGASTQKDGASTQKERTSIQKERTSTQKEQKYTERAHKYTKRAGFCKNSAANMY